MSSSGKIDTLANIAVIVASLVCIGVWTQTYFNASGDPATRTYVPGEAFPAASLLSSKGTDATFVLYVSSTCTYCTESMAFYRKMVADSRETNGRSAIVVLSREPVESLQRYLSSHGVVPDAVARVTDTDAPRLKFTPVLIQIDSGAVVRRAWTGKLTPSGEAQVLELLKPAAAL